MSNRRNRHAKPAKPIPACPWQGKGKYGHRIIRAGSDDQREYHLHATKGWRNYRKEQ